jgi:hypothetical protein
MIISTDTKKKKKISTTNITHDGGKLEACPSGSGTRQEKRTEVVWAAGVNSGGKSTCLAR